MPYQNPDGTWSYQGSTVKYASEGAANYYGPRDSYEYTPTSTTYHETAASTYIKEGSPEAWAFYGLDPKTGTISADKLKILQTGYLPTQSINKGTNSGHSTKPHHEITDKEARERGINRVFGGKDYRAERKKERKAANKQARIEAGPNRPYAALGISKRVNPYGYDNPNFPVLSYEASGRGTAQKDIRQSENTLLEVGYGGQVNYAPRGVQILQERRARREQTALKMEYQKEYGNINPQISEAAYRPMSDLGTTNISADNQISEASYKPMSISRKGLDKTNALRKSQGLPSLEDVKALIIYEKSPGEQADEIIAEARKEGASKIQIYSEDNQPVGSLKTESARPLLINFLSGSEPFRYAYTIPKNKEALTKAKKERTEFRNYIKEYNKLGTGMFDIYQGNNLATRTTSEHPLYDIMKAEKKYGEVSISPTPAIFLTNKPQPIHPKNSLGGLATLFNAPFYNTGVEAYYGLTKAPEAKVGLPLSERATKEKALYEIRDPINELISTGKLPKGTTMLESEASFFGNAALFGLSFIGGGKQIKPKTTEASIGLGLGKSVPITTKYGEAHATMTRVLRPTNPMRTPLPKGILGRGEPEPGQLSANRPTTSPKLQKRNTYIPSAPERPATFENTSLETSKRLSQIQEGLITKREVTKKTKVLEPTQPVQISKGYKPRKTIEKDFASTGSMIGDLKASGLIPLKNIPKFERPAPNEPQIRSESVESTAPIFRNEVYSSSGTKLNKTFGDIAIKDIITPEVRIPKTKQTISEGYLGSTKRSLVKRKNKAFTNNLISQDKGIPDELLAIGKSPIKNAPKFEEPTPEQPPARAKKYDISRIKSLSEVFTAGGKRLSGTYGDTIVKDIITPATKARGKQSLPESYLGTTKRIPKTRKNKAFSRELIKGDTAIPSELLAAGKPPIKSSLSKDFDEFRKFQTRIDREKQQGIFTKETGIGALGKKLEVKTESSNYLGPTKKSFKPRKNKAFSKTIYRQDNTIPNELLAAGRPPIKSKIDYRPRRSKLIEEQNKLYDKKGIGALARKEEKTIKEVKGYEPNIREFKSRLGRNKKPKNKGKIDANKLLGIEQEPEVGEPKDYTKKLEENLKKKSKPEEIPITAIKTKDTSKPKISTQDFINEDKANVGLDIHQGRRQSTIQIHREQEVIKSNLEPQTKISSEKTPNPFKNKITTKTTATPLKKRRTILTSQAYAMELENIFLHENRPQSSFIRTNASRMEIAQQRRQGLELTHRSILTQRSGIKQVSTPITRTRTRTKLKTIQKPKQIQRQQTETIAILTTKQKTANKLVQRQQQRTSLIFKTPNITINPTKLITSQAQKQPQRQTTKPKFPTEPPPRTRLIFIPPPGELKSSRPKPKKGKPKYNFLGNAPVSEISGLYGKRADILYGQKRTAKLVRIDIQKSKRGNFVSLQGRRGLAHTPKPYFTKAKSKRKSKPKRWI